MKKLEKFRKEIEGIKDEKTLEEKKKEFLEYHSSKGRKLGYHRVVGSCHNACPVKDKNKCPLSEEFEGIKACLSG